jgi:hypothetical protein
MEDTREVTVVGSVTDANHVASAVFSDSGKPANGEGPLKKHSMTDPMHDKLKLPQPDDVEK